MATVQDWNPVNPTSFRSSDSSFATHGTTPGIVSSADAHTMIIASWHAQKHDVHVTTYHIDIWQSWMEYKFNTIILECK